MAAEILSLLFTFEYYAKYSGSITIVHIRILCKIFRFYHYCSHSNIMQNIQVLSLLFTFEYYAKYSKIAFAQDSFLGYYVSEIFLFSSVCFFLPRLLPPIYFMICILQFIS